MSWWNRLASFISEVRAELKKSTWPGWNEVKGTTIVVIVTSFMLSVFLWVVDIIFQRIVGGMMEFFTA